MGRVSLVVVSLVLCISHGVATVATGCHRAYITSGDDAPGGFMVVVIYLPTLINSLK